MTLSLSSEVTAALLGALTGIGGSGLVSWKLERARFRRADREGARERLALARGLRWELVESRQTLSFIIRDQKIAPGARFQYSLWESHGHHLLGALEPSAAEVLVDAFVRLRQGSSFMEVAQDHGGLEISDPELSNALPLLDQYLEKAMDLLQQIEEQYLVRDDQLS